MSCTYGSLSGRVSAVSYARHLEQKVAELQALLRQRPEEQSQMVLDSQEFARDQMLDMIVGLGDGYVYRIPQTGSNYFYGGFGGLSALRAVSNTGFHGSGMATAPSPGRDFVEAFETTSLLPTTGVEARTCALLPSKQQVQNLAVHASRTALTCHDCLDFDDFTIKLDRLYTIDPEDYSPNDKSFLILVYALVALGRRYMPSTEEDEIDEVGNTVKFKGSALPKTFIR